jgi:hypothetical protein
VCRRSAGAGKGVRGFGLRREGQGGGITRRDHSRDRFAEIVGLLKRALEGLATALLWKAMLSQTGRHRNRSFSTPARPHPSASHRSPQGTAVFFGGVCSGADRSNVGSLPEQSAILHGQMAPGRTGAAILATPAAPPMCCLLTLRRTAVSRGGVAGASPQGRAWSRWQAPEEARSGAAVEAGSDGALRCVHTKSAAAVAHWRAHTGTAASNQILEVCCSGGGAAGAAWPLTADRRPALEAAQQGEEGRHVRCQGAAGQPV